MKQPKVSAVVQLPQKRGAYLPTLFVRDLDVIGTAPDARVRTGKKVEMNIATQQGFFEEYRRFKAMLKRVTEGDQANTRF